MRIAFDAKRAFANSRGLGNYSRDTLRLMATYAPEHAYYYFGVPTERFCPSTGIVVSPQGIWKAVPSLWRSMGCVADLKRKGIEVYHGLSGEIPFGIHRTGIKTIVTVHDLIFLRYPELYSRTYRWLFTEKVRYACRYATRIIAISEQTKQDIIDYFGVAPDRITVVYQGCSNQFRQPVSAEQVKDVLQRHGIEGKYIIDVGAIEPRKNLKNLLLGMAEAHIDTPLVVIGGHSRYADEMKALAGQLGLDVRMLHGAPFADFPALYKGAECLVYPSVFEGFGIPILEAMCAGTPVVTSVGSCFQETGGDAALYADPYSPSSIGEQLKRVLSDAALREKMTACGYAQSEKFTDEEVAHHLIDVYATL